MEILLSAQSVTKRNTAQALREPVNPSLIPSALCFGEADVESGLSRCLIPLKPTRQSHLNPPPLLLHQLFRGIKTCASRQYSRAARSSFIRLFYFFCHEAQLQWKFYLLIGNLREGCHTLVLQISYISIILSNLLAIQLSDPSPVSICLCL